MTYDILRYSAYGIGAIFLIGALVLVFMMTKTKENKVSALSTPQRKSSSVENEQVPFVKESFVADKTKEVKEPATSLRRLSGGTNSSVFMQDDDVKLP